MADLETVVPTESPAAADTSTPAAAPADTGSTEPVSRRDAIARAVEGKPDTGEKPDTGATRARDVQGKFVPQKNTQTASTGAVVGGETAAQIKERKYPSSWKPDYKPHYEKLASNAEYAGILDEIDRREGEYHKGLEPYKQSAQFAQSIQRVMQPYQQTIQQFGMQPEQVIETLLRAEHQIRTGTPEQKLAQFMQLAQQYGVPIDGLPEPRQIDPMVNQLYQRMTQQEAMLNQYLTANQQREYESANESINQFAKDHEYLPEVRELMADLIDKGFAKGLEDAYDQAIWSKPDIRAKAIAKHNSSAEQKRKEAALAAVNTAKSAAVQVRGAPSTGQSATRIPSGKNRRDTIARLMES